MLSNPIQIDSLTLKSRWLFGALVIGLGISLASQAVAAITTGDRFTVVFSETTPQIIPDGATATLTLGALKSPGFFEISSFSAISGTGVCLTCGLETEDLSGVLFDATTLGLQGHITGSFLGQNGGQHTFDLALTDPGATWLFTNVHVTGGFTEMSSGTYATVRAVDEPSVMLMVGLGATGLAWLRRRVERRRAADR